MNPPTIQIQFSEIRSHVLGVDYCPFRAKEIIGPRISYTHVFLYIKSGRGTITIDGVTYEAADRCLFYIQPGIIHSFHADATDPMVYASLYIDLLWSSTPKLKGDLGLNCYEIEAYQPQLSAANVQFKEGIVIPTKTNTPHNAKWMESFLAVMDHFDYRGIDTEIRLRSLFEAFFSDYIHYLAHPFAPADPRIRKLIHWMEEHIYATFSTADWAEQLLISQAYLYELFHKETGVSPQYYFNSCKLAQAKKELRETNQSVTSIAERLGFATIHYFSRQYSSHYLESPSQYRKRIRGNAPTP
jgi:AraC-like DNA-binding protein